MVGGGSPSSDLRPVSSSPRAEPDKAPPLPITGTAKQTRSSRIAEAGAGREPAIWPKMIAFCPNPSPNAKPSCNWRRAARWRDSFATDATLIYPGVAPLDVACRHAAGLRRRQPCRPPPPHRSFPVIHMADTQHVGGHQGFTNESLTARGESSHIGHASPFEACPAVSRRSPVTDFRKFRVCLTALRRMGRARDFSRPSSFFASGKLWRRTCG